MVPSLPEGETYVYADGRHLWRVIDNLLGNCAKYAMEGTRIYLELVRGKGQVTLSMKNISRDPLNVPPERLMERFVRGDESRTTEGSGLGLSIARSLTELQGGTFRAGGGRGPVQGHRDHAPVGLSGKRGEASASPLFLSSARKRACVPASCIGTGFLL